MMRQSRRRSFLAAGLLLLLAPLCVGLSAATSTRDDWSMLGTGETVFKAACANCHGVRGTGTDHTLLGFDVTPPDFTSCAFTTREQRPDWVGIATEGGPLRGFSPMMPAFGRVLTREQISAAVDHVKGFCADRAWPQGELNLPKALNTGKAFPENEVALSLSSTASEPWALSGKLVVASRVGARHQIEAAVPFGVQQVEYEKDNGEKGLRIGEGIADVALAWKSVLWHSLVLGTIGSVTLDVFLPTGDEADGLSEGIFAFEPALAIGQIIPRLGFIQLQGGAELSTNTDKASHGVFWRGALGRSFRKDGYRRAWTPMVEVLGSAELGENTTVEWSVVPELQIGLSRRQHVRLAGGVLIPMTHYEERQLEIMAYLIWDWYDGGFTEGW